MTRKSYSQILDRVAQESMTRRTDLAPRIIAQIQKGKDRRMPTRTRVLVIALVVLLMAVVVLVKVPAVAAAIQRWFGYMPNVGLIHQGQIRTLAEPVTATRDGITLTIEQVVVDPDRTTVIYSVEGLTQDMLESKPAVNSPGCYQEAVLRFPGSELQEAGLTGTSWMTGYEHRATYAVIPAAVNDVTFALPCIRSALPGKAPEDWELSIRLIPAPADMTALPVIEIPTPLETPTAVGAPSGDGISMEGVSLSLDRAVQMEDGYLIYATLHWENVGFSYLNAPETANLQLEDANGEAVAWTFDLDATMSLTQQRGQTAFVIKTAPIETAGPLTITIDALSVAVTTNASFPFEAGPDPQPGQVWEVNQTVDLGYGHSLRVVTAKYPTPPASHLPQRAGLAFEMESESGVAGAMLIDREHPVAGGGGGGGGSFPGRFTAGFSYQDAVPEGPIQVDIESIWVTVPGRWEAVWTPPQVQEPASQQKPACLTEASWQEALRQLSALPAGLGGKLALSQITPPTYYYEASLVGLDGTVLTSIGPGSAPALSPDGRMAAYVGPNQNGPSDGLYLMDLASGQTSRIAATGKGDIGPLWAPDGQRLLFTRGPSSGLIGAPGPYNLMIMNADGTGLHPLTQGPEASYAMAWMPDGKGVLFTQATRGGASLKLMQIETGETRALFNLNYSGTVVVSPDGTRLAFEEMLPLDKYGLFVSDLDGSNRVLLSDGNPYTVTVPLWSLDGEWVAASVHAPDPTQNPNPTLALIQVDTCRVIALPNITGYASSWVP